ncbi:MAG: hypothetical protein ACLTOV_09055 [Phocaeicola sp.]
MKNLLLIIFCAFTAIALKAQPPSIEALRTCAAEKGMSPKEYIFKLFEKSDIVVLGERDHRDTIQYDLIHDILADPRFAEQVGHVYTEVGSYNMTDDVNRLLQGVYPTEAVFMDSLYAYYRKSETFYPIWEKSNRVKFLKGIYEVNRTSPKKIKLGLTDCEFSWDEIRTVEDFKKFWKSPGLNDRDSVMAAHISEMYARQTPLNGKCKALVITNQPHAINYSMILKKTNTVYGAQGWWMKKNFGEEKVKIVVLNWFDYNLFDGSNFPMTGDGHWDAAFELLQCHPFAIDLKNTPYGKTAYNGLAGGTTSHVKNKCWQDVADGLIYYAPLYDHVAAWGVEGIITKEFEPEIKRRLTIFFQATQPGIEIPIKAAIDEYNVFHTFPTVFRSKEEVKDLIMKVLEKNP